MPALRFQMLGSFEGWYDRRPLLLPPTVKSQSLLAYLVLNRARPQSRDHLLGIYWPEYPEHRARRSLTTALWHIRRCLPENTLASDTQQVQLTPASDFALDVAQFRALAARADPASLEAACKLYRGDFLDGFFDDWVVEERYQLQALLAQVLARLMAGYEEAGAHRDALAAALQLLERDPLQEEAHRLVMRVRCRLGRRHLAIAQYRRCEEALHRELGVAPATETTQLYQAILDGRFAVGGAGEEPAAVAREVRPAARDPLAAPWLGPMVGRERELALLADRWREAAAGQGGLLLIEGEAGVGKTRLLDEFARQVRGSDGWVLSGRCYEFERALPYQPFPDLLRGALPLVSLAELRACPAWALAEVARLAPELAELQQAGPPAPGENSPAQGGPGHLFDGILRFFTSLVVDKPLLIVLDDLHWAGRSCLQLVHYLARHVGEQPILLLAAFRPEAAGEQPVFLSFQRDLATEEPAVTLQLPPLPAAQVEAMIRGMSGDAEGAGPLARRLSAETEGNPFFLIELLRSLFEAGAVRIAGGAWQIDLDRVLKEGPTLRAEARQAIERRTARLSPDAARVLQDAAVLGQEFDFAALDSMWDRGEEPTLAALDELLRRRLLVESSGPASRDYSFSHKLIQEAVYGGLARHKRGHLHALAAAAIERIYARQIGDVTRELAFHYTQAQQHDPALGEKAGTYLILAGDKARELDMPQEAASYYEQALGLLRDRPAGQVAARTYMKLGLVQHRALNFEASDEAYRRGAILWQGTGRTPPRADLGPAPHPLRMEWPEPHSLNPLMIRTYEDTYVLDQLFGALVEDITQEREVLPGMARSWELHDGGRRYVFHLDEQARWSDGSSVTATDFVQALRMLLAPDTAWYAASDYYAIRGAREYNQGLAGVDALAVRAGDEHTIEIELADPGGYFLEGLVRVQPIPVHCLRRYGEDWAAPEHLVGNGPFQVEKWERGTSLTLRRNPYYHLPVTGNLQQIEFTFKPYEDWQGSLAAYEADRLDVLNLVGLPPEVAETVKARHADEYISWPDDALYILSFATDQPPFTDVRVRRAFVHALDRVTLAQRDLNGTGYPATGGLVPPSIPGHSPGIGLAHDPDLARRLLAEAGYPGGIGLPAVNCMLESCSVDVAIRSHLQGQWAGVLDAPVSLELVDLADLADQFREHGPRAWVMGIISIYPYADCYLHIAQIFEPQGHHWHDPEFDRLVAESGSTVDPKQRMALLQQADRLLMEAAVVVPLFYPRMHALIKPWVKGFTAPANFPARLWDVVIEPH